MPDPATQIEHVIIVMMENRSFDHMLGYLSLEGHPVDGLTPTMSNRDEQGVEHKVFELDDPVFAGRPCIEPDCIATQLKDA